jgi:transcriptional regulator with XRE-family HTH domain
VSNKSYSTVRMIELRPDALKKWRAEMTQGELADKAGVSRATINRIEQGHSENVTLATINAIAKALDVDADVLVRFDR